MTSQSDQVHRGEAERWGGWFWRESVRGEHMTTLLLELNLHDVTTIDGELEVLIPVATQDLLERLGWTAPAA